MCEHGRTERKIGTSVRGNLPLLIQRRCGERAREKNTGVEQRSGVDKRIKAANSHSAFVHASFLSLLLFSSFPFSFTLLPPTTVTHTYNMLAAKINGTWENTLHPQSLHSKLLRRALLSSTSAANPNIFCSMAPSFN